MEGARVLNQDELEAITSKLNIRNKLIVKTQLTFGLRIQEALKLKFKDVSNKFLSVESDKKSVCVTFPLPDDYKKDVKELKKFYQYLGKQIEDDTYLFLSQKYKNNPISRQQFSGTLKNICEELNLDGNVSSHSFRKMFVTRIYQMTGKDLAETKHFSRHRNLGNLDHYIKTTKNLDLIHDLKWFPSKEDKEEE